MRYPHQHTCPSCSNTVSCRDDSCPLPHVVKCLHCNGFDPGDVSEVDIPWQSVLLCDEAFA